MKLRVVIADNTFADPRAFPGFVQIRRSMLLCVLCHHFRSIMRRNANASTGKNTAKKHHRLGTLPRP